MTKNIGHYISGFVMYVLYFGMYFFFGYLIPEFSITINYLIDFGVLIILFGLFSLLRTLFFKKKSTNAQIGALSVSFIGMYLIIDVVLNSIKFYQMFDGFSATAAVIFLLIQTFIFVGSKILIASYFVNLFQSMFGIKEKIKIPLFTQVKVTIGLLFSLAAIYVLYYLLFYYGGIWIFMLGGILPLVIASFFLRGPKGQKVKQEDHPKLFKVISRVAEKVGLKKPKQVLLTHDTGIAVTGVFKKTMIIGVAALNAISVDELESIIAHEFGHFYGNDTVIGYFLAHIQTSLATTVKGLSAVRRMPAFLFIYYLFILFYSYVFAFVTMAYSRQVEFRADIVAAQVSGSNIFSKGLLDYAAYSIFFEQTAYKAIVELAKTNKIFKNIYDHSWKVYSSKGKMQEHIEKSKQDLIKEKTSMFSTHPSIGVRMENIKHMPKKEIVNKKPAQTLFKNLDEIEKDMTKGVSSAFFFKLGLIDKDGNIIKKKEDKK